MNTVEYLSLREISRRLGIPPSSVIYYRDRFDRFIPPAEGKGRRKTYPATALTLFKEIREMFDNNWSAERIERELARKGTAVFQGAFFDEEDHEEAFAHPGGVARELTGVLEKLSDLLENQALFRGEIDSLRREVELLRREKAELETGAQGRIDALESEIQALRKERAELFDRIMEHLDQGAANGLTPPESFLGLPLVIRTEQNEYLGVAGKTRHFSLKEFIRIIERNIDARKDIQMQWTRRGTAWQLRISTKDKDSRAHHEHLLEVAQTLTPSGNTVTRLTNLTIDGNPVPEPFLLVLFRKIKDGFDE